MYIYIYILYIYIYMYIYIYVYIYLIPDIGINKNFFHNFKFHVLQSSGD